jgi:hypothetical protein
MRGTALFVVLILSGCASSQVAHAPAVSPRARTAIGEETIGQFRSWEHKVQAAYVLGFRSLAYKSGLVCDRRTTIGETVTALTTRPDFTPDMRLHKALAILFEENGCLPAEKPSDEDMA